MNLESVGMGLIDTHCGPLESLSGQGCQLGDRSVPRNSLWSPAETPPARMDRVIPANFSSQVFGLVSLTIYVVFGIFADAPFLGNDTHKTQPRWCVSASLSTICLLLACPGRNHVRTSSFKPK